MNNTIQRFGKRSRIVCVRKDELIDLEDCEMLNGCGSTKRCNNKLKKDLAKGGFK